MFDYLKPASPRITISCKINVQNWESVIVSVEGNSKEECLNLIRDALAGMGKDEVTREQIQKYVSRVIG